MYVCMDIDYRFWVSFCRIMSHWDHCFHRHGEVPTVDPHTHTHTHLATSSNYSFLYDAVVFHLQKDAAEVRTELGSTLSIFFLLCQGRQ